LLFDTPISDSGVDRSIVFTAVATVGSFVLAISYLVFRSQKAKPTLGKEGLIGEIGEARTKLAPTGRIFVHGEHWGAEADGAVESGEKVRVIGYDGMRLKVTRVAEGGAKN
jgi:membrane-bound serine protease (ClpP class)